MPFLWPGTSVIWLRSRISHTRKHGVWPHYKQTRAKKLLFFINDQSKNKIPTKENNSLMNQYFHCNTCYCWMLSMCTYSMINIIDLNFFGAFASFDSAISVRNLALFNQSISQSITQSINHSINQSINHSINQSINHSINQSFDQSINQLVNQSISQSIDGTNELSTYDWSANQLTE